MAEEMQSRRMRRHNREKELRQERWEQSIFIVRAKAALEAEPAKWLDTWMTFTELWEGLGSRTEMPASPYWESKGWFTTPAAMATHIYSLPTVVWQELGLETDLKLIPSRPNPVSILRFSSEIDQN